MYDVMADTIGYIQVEMRAASLQLARTHTRFTRCARDEIINSLRSALRASLREELLNNNNVAWSFAGKYEQVSTYVSGKIQLYQNYKS